MVRIRLRRVGLHGQPSYRIVVADKESPRDGRFLEIVGFYNPRTEPSTLTLKEDRVYDWLSKGAQPSEPIVRLFNSVKLMDRFARSKLVSQLKPCWLKPTLFMQTGLLIT